MPTVEETIKRTQEFQRAFYNARRLQPLTRTLEAAREAYATGRITLEEYERAVERLI